MKKIILLLFIFLFTGCFNYGELNKMAIVTSIGIDKVKDKYLVSVQVINAKKDNEKGSNITVYTHKGHTIFEALRETTLKSPKKLYGGHMEKLVLSKEVAEDGIINVIDSFERISDIKNEFNIIILENGKAYNLLKILTTSENIPAEYVKHTIDIASKYTSLTYSTKLDEFLSLYLKKGIDPVIPLIKVNNYNKDGSTLENINTSSPISKISTIEKLGLTKDGKLIDYLNKNETIGYNFLKKGKNKTIISLKCDNNNYISLTLSNKTKYKIKKDNNKYFVKYILNISGTVNEYNCDKDLNNKKNLRRIEKKVKKKIDNYLNQTINKQYNSNSKFLGLENIIYLQNYKYNNEKIIVKTNINVLIKDIGQTNKSLKGAKKDEE